MPVSKIIKVNTDIGYSAVSFTPAFYKRAVKNFLAGDMRDLLSLISAAENDGFVAGCLIARNAGYKRDWQIAPATDSAQDVKIAETVQSVLSNIFMREFFEDMIDARYKYYSVLALEWDVVNGQQVPVYYEKYDQKYFKYDKDNILKIDFGKTLKDIEQDSAFVIESSRKPVMLTVLADFILKEYGRQAWSAFIEVFGEPFIFAEYPVGASKEEIAAAETGVNKIAQSSRGVVPEGTKINLLEAQRTTGDHKDFVREGKEGISMALLGHMDAAGSDKTTQIGDNTSGLQVAQKIAVDDMFWIEEKIKPFIKMIVNKNYNTSVYPSLTLDKTNQLEPTIILDYAQLALDSGGEIPPEFFTKRGIPVIVADGGNLKKQPLFTSSGL